MKSMNCGGQLHISTTGVICVSITCPRHAGQYTPPSSSTLCPTNPVPRILDDLVTCENTVWYQRNSLIISVWSLSEFEFPKTQMLKQGFGHKLLICKNDPRKHWERCGEVTQGRNRNQRKLSWPSKWPPWASGAQHRHSEWSNSEGVGHGGRIHQCSSVCVWRLLPGNVNIQST